MKISCPYCGRIHERSFDCGRRTRINPKRADQVSRFRSGTLWRAKSEAIRDRDSYLCQVCIRNLYDTDVQYNGENLSVHHIVPLEKNFDLRLDDDNLITLCSKHHEMAEAGKIPEAELHAIAAEQQSKLFVI